MFSMMDERYFRNVILAIQLPCSVSCVLQLGPQSVCVHFPQKLLSEQHQPDAPHHQRAVAVLTAVVQRRVLGVLGGLTHPQQGALPGLDHGKKPDGAAGSSC